MSTLRFEQIFLESNTMILFCGTRSSVIINLYHGGFVEGVKFSKMIKMDTKLDFQLCDAPKVCLLN